MPIKIVADKTAGRRQHVRSSKSGAKTSSWRKRPKGKAGTAQEQWFKKGGRTSKQFGGPLARPMGGVGARPMGGVGARPLGGARAPIRPVGFKGGKSVKK